MKIIENRKIQHFKMSVIAAISHIQFIFVLKDLCSKEIDCLSKIIEKASKTRECLVCGCHTP